MEWLQKTRRSTSALVLTLFRIGGGGAKRPPTSFSPVTSTNIGIKPRNFLIFSLTHFPHRCRILSLYLVLFPNYWTWAKINPQQKWFFWSNLQKFEVVITSLIEILELPNFDQVTRSTILFESRDRNLLMTSMTKNYDVIIFFQNAFILWKPEVALFADIIKIVTMFIKIIFKDSIEVKRITNHV